MRIDWKSASVARRPHKRGQKKKVHYLAPAGGQLTAYESRLEASAGAAFGLDPRVVSARTQPMTFDLATGRRFPTKEDLFQWVRDSGSRPIIYTPDFELQLQTGSILVEVKHAELIARAPKVLAYPSILARYGYRLVILDDRVLHDAFVRNMRSLTMAWTYSPNRSEITNLQADSSDWVSLGALRDRGYPDALVLGCLARGHLTCDVQRERISKNTLIRTVVDKPSHLMELPLDACRTS
ncbi:hypothetical protein [Salipiger bermudensis]|uniref:hypothetical protein n=1 Tax=Salipiger bermudensis TaxID=344736 RepID=UPI00300BB978